ncbi:DUF4268 domain-containing protein [Euzebya sp.]|uniref:DUF4268 domain-containing protein n=1 Tax=Euzebya sp. TaxID=1971409 RepID=UPI00351247B6
MDIELGRLEPVVPRTVWAHEAQDFTPWLLAHPDDLAEALGIELEFTAAEHPVGPYALDLVGRDLTHDAVLIVENQLEATDHSHLGQLLTHTAGTGAATIVWIATRMRDEHRQALDWLNQETGEGIRFFGVELRVVRIGTSAPAPLLDVVAEPNDWQKHVRAAARAEQSGGKGEIYLRFWTRYLERVHDEHPGWTRARKPQTANWISQPAGVPGAYISVSFAAGARLRHELYIDSEDGEVNQRTFDALSAHRDLLEEQYGRQLSFEPLSNRRACRIAEYRDDGDAADVDRHEDFIDWFFDAGVRLRRAIAALPARWIDSGPARPDVDL